jgi:hypothetical protein
MSDTTVCKPPPDADSGVVALPTRQKNALRLLLNKPEISPGEVAALDYRSIERAPGIGKKSVALIRTWLNGHGYELSGLPSDHINPHVAQRRRKLERAIDYLRGQGYEVHRSR